MIDSRVSLNNYLRTDFERQGMSYPLLARISYGEHGYVWHYIKILRHLEYYLNTKERSFINKLLYYIYFYRYRKLCVKSNIYIMPNTIGKGLLIPHPGFIRVDSFCTIGENCTILPMVLFGKKHPGIEGKIVVGDNCYISAGVTIL